MRKMLLLPALFLIVVTPIFVFVVSGTGTDMSALLLYPFGWPWWYFLPYESMPGAEYPHVREYIWLGAGCAMNALLLAFVGFLIDRRARSRGVSR